LINRRASHEQHGSGTNYRAMCLESISFRNLITLYTDLAVIRRKRQELHRIDRRTDQLAKQLLRSEKVFSN